MFDFIPHAKSTETDDAEILNLESWIRKKLPIKVDFILFESGQNSRTAITLTPNVYEERLLNCVTSDGGWFHSLVWTTINRASPSKARNKIS